MFAIGIFLTYILQINALFLGLLRGHREYSWFDLTNEEEVTMGIVIPGERERICNTSLVMKPFFIKLSKP